MHFDVLFLDTTSPKYYDRMTLEREALGGSEATVIRVAEGLGSLGLKVCVLQSRVSYFEPISGQFAFFMHSDDASGITCRHYIQIRVNNHPEIFKGAKKYVWLHDVASKQSEETVKSLIDNNIKVIGVSRWHRNNILENFAGYENVTYVYNPVQDELYADPNTQTDYDRNMIVWPASPHKGLSKAIELFKKIREGNPKMNMAIFNPGYKQLDGINLSIQPGLMVYGPNPCKSVWSVVKNSLCVFYPTEWSETFGLVAAEANALGVPLVTNPLAALKEVVSSDNQFIESDEQAVKRVLDWSANGRPLTVGKDEFRFSEVLLSWVRLLAS